MVKSRELRCISTLTYARDTLKRIFQPLITDILRLVDDQVNLVTVKRMTENHPKAKEIKVGEPNRDATLQLILGIGNLSGRRVRVERVSKAVP